MVDRYQPAVMGTSGGYSCVVAGCLGYVGFEGSRLVGLFRYRSRPQDAQVILYCIMLLV